MFILVRIDKPCDQLFLFIVNIAFKDIWGDYLLSLVNVGMAWLKMTLCVDKMFEDLSLIIIQLFFKQII